MSSLTDKVLIITGASDGPGKAMAVYFLHRGGRVVAHGQSADRLKPLDAEFRSFGYDDDRWLTVDGDISNEADCRKLVDMTVDKFHRLDVLINNAAVILKEGMYRQSLVVFDQLVASNLQVMNTLTELCIPHLTQTSGSIINVNSLSTFLEAIFLRHPQAEMTKTALEQFSRHCAKTYETRQVRVFNFDSRPFFDSTFNFADCCFTYKEHFHQWCKANGWLESKGKLEKLAMSLVLLLKKNS